MTRITEHIYRKSVSLFRMDSASNVTIAASYVLSALSIFGLLWILNKMIDPCAVFLQYLISLQTLFPVTLISLVSAVFLWVVNKFWFIRLTKSIARSTVASTSLFCFTSIVAVFVLVVHFAGVRGECRSEVGRLVVLRQWDRVESEAKQVDTNYYVKEWKDAIRNYVESHRSLFQVSGVYDPRKFEIIYNNTYEYVQGGTHLEYNVPTLIAAATYMDRSGVSGKIEPAIKLIMQNGRGGLATWHNWRDAATLYVELRQSAKAIEFLERQIKDLEKIMIDTRQPDGGNLLPPCERWRSANIGYMRAVCFAEYRIANALLDIEQYSAARKKFEAIPPGALGYLAAYVDKGYAEAMLFESIKSRGTNDEARSDVSDQMRRAERHIELAFRHSPKDRLIQFSRALVALEADRCDDAKLMLTELGESASSFDDNEVAVLGMAGYVAKMCFGHGQEATQWWLRALRSSDSLDHVSYVLARPDRIERLVDRVAASIESSQVYGRMIYARWIRRMPPRMVVP